MPSDGGSGPGGSDGQDGGRGGDSSSNSNSNSNSGGNMGGSFGGIGNWGGGSENDSSEDGSPGAVGGFGGLGYGGFSGMEGSNMNNSITDSMGNVIARRGPLGGFYATAAGMQATDRGFGAHANYSSVSPGTQAAIAQAEAADKAARQAAMAEHQKASMAVDMNNPYSAARSMESIANAINEGRMTEAATRAAYAGIATEAQTAKAYAEAAAQRGILGKLRDSVFNVNRTVSENAIKEAKERGTLSELGQGIATGMVSATPEGNPTQDSFGQFSNAFGGLAPAAFGFALGPIGSMMGTTFGKALSAIGPQLGLQSISPTAPNLGSAINAITGNMTSLGSVLGGPFGSVMSGLNDISSINNALGFGPVARSTATSPASAGSFYDYMTRRMY